MGVSGGASAVALGASASAAGASWIPMGVSGGASVVASAGASASAAGASWIPRGVSAGASVVASAGASVSAAGASVMVSGGAWAVVWVGDSMLTSRVVSVGGPLASAVPGSSPDRPYEVTKQNPDTTCNMCIYLYTTCIIYIYI